MAHIPNSRWRAKNGLIATCVAILVMFLLSACGGSPQTQQAASASKANLDTLLSQARSIGVPESMLQPIIQQEAQISNTSAPVTIFDNQPATDYYANLSQRYQTLAVQVRGLEDQTTQQFDYQASLDLQAMENALALRQSQNFVEAKTFSNQLTQYQGQLAKAQYPKDYTQISTSAKNSTLALNLMGPAY